MTTEPNSSQRICFGSFAIEVLNFMVSSPAFGNNTHYTMSS